MRNLSDTISRLAARRDAGLSGYMPSGAPNGLLRLPDVGSNPGALRAHVHIPASLGAGAALVVVLHGCTQTAAGYDVGAGWSEMADRHGFALLFPEQQRQNNPNLCFNWFAPEDSRRGGGEALSIHQMIEAVVTTHEIDPARIYVTGLSAGGAMASVMLAAYPEMFSGGAIIAGLPFGTASTMSQAFDRMRGHGLPGAAHLATLVRNASDHRGPWPTISIWQGSADATVSPANAEAILGQWRSLHGVDADHSRVQVVDGYPRRSWCDDRGREVIEAYSITGMGHGTPLEASGAEGCGNAGPYMLDVGISSTRHLCRFWGLATVENDLGEAPSAAPRAAATPLVPSPAFGQTGDEAAAPPSGSPPRVEPLGAAGGVGRVIEDALRAAGLMR